VSDAVETFTTKVRFSEFMDCNSAVESVYRRFQGFNLSATFSKS
jgi:hypothetical protein